MLPVVTITNFCLNHSGYFDWLTTGLGLLEQQGHLKLRFRLPTAKKLLRQRYLRWGAKALAPSWVSKINGPMWWLEAEVDFGGRIIRIVFDVTDHGYNFAEHLLPTCDLYFKCQLPKAFPQPLQLCKLIARPMPAAAIEHAAKIRPAMLGRPLSRSLDFKKNLRILSAWEEKSKLPVTKRLFAYFGGDTDAEADNRLADFKGLYHHPNQKRGRLIRDLKQSDKRGIDARLVNSDDSLLRGPALSDDDSYSSAVATSAFNLNISGLSLSIPFRLIDSFMVGTTIITDSLSIGWYKPFEKEEVIELGVMGYELESEVNWERVKEVLDNVLNLSPSEDAPRRNHLLDRYHRLWSPEALARYILTSCKELA